jgi:hypothetical protein
MYVIFLWYRYVLGPDICFFWWIFPPLRLMVLFCSMARLLFKSGNPPCSHDHALSKIHTMECLTFINNNFIVYNKPFLLSLLPFVNKTCLFRKPFFSTSAGFFADLWQLYVNKRPPIYTEGRRAHCLDKYDKFARWFLHSLHICKGFLIQLSKSVLSPEIRITFC